MQFIMRRLWFYLAAFFVAITLNFFIPRWMPGDPTTRIFAGLRGKLSPEAMDAIRRSYGYEGSLFDQYIIYLNNLVHFDFGVSTTNFPEPTSDLLFYSAAWTLLLVGLATAISFFIGIWMGIYSAWHRGGFFDTFFTPINVMLNAFTPAIVALILFYAFSLEWRIFPLGRAHDINMIPNFSFEFIINVLYHATLPVLSIVIVTFGSWHLGMRNTMINLLNEDFVILAKAKGLSDSRVKNRYVARNAILPQITALSLYIGYILGGSLITEYVFNYPGLGKFTLSAIQARDYSFVQAQLLLLTACVLIANLISDILNVVLDPRLR